MKMWIARNEDNSLILYPSKPSRGYDDITRKWYWGCYSGENMELPEGEYPEVTFENSPQQVEIKLIEE